MTWPPGDGEMAARVRAHDWSATALGSSEAWPERLKAAVELVIASPMIATLAVGEDRLFFYNDAAAALYGARHPGALGRPLPEIFPETYDIVAGYYDGVFAGSAATVRALPLAVGTAGSAEVFDAYLTPIRGADGAVIAAHMTGIEIGERVRIEAALRESEARLQTLVAELQHRVRNILTVIRSIFKRTTEAGEDLEDVTRHFQGRLDSLARTQVIVTRNSEGTVDLEGLIRDELMGVIVGRDPEPLIEGPDISLNFETAEMFGLAIHELTTNSLKYGALRFGGAKLKIRWSANIDGGGARTLNFTWDEQGVPMVSVSPSRSGFGRELIEEALPYRTGATTSLEFRGGGMRCNISLPLPAAGDSHAKM